MLTEVDFLNFLEEEGVQQQFVNNYLSLDPISDPVKALEKVEDEIREFIVDAGARASLPGLISGAFDWGSSPEGHKVWSDINKKWLKVIRGYRYGTRRKVQGDSD